MTRRGQDAKARARRHRAAVTIRSQSARRASLVSPKAPAPTAMGTTSTWVPPSVTAAIVPTTNTAPSRPLRTPLRRVRIRKPPPAAIPDAVEQLRQLVAQRESASVAVDREVNRLRRLGASWPDVAKALGVSRQAARQKYTARGEP